MSDVRVTMRHVRGAKMCSRGARAFFEKHKLDWNEFLKVGIAIEQLEKTEDPMALQVVEIAKNGRK